LRASWGNVYKHSLHFAHGVIHASANFGRTGALGLLVYNGHAFCNNAYNVWIMLSGISLGQCLNYIHFGARGSASPSGSSFQLTPSRTGSSFQVMPPSRGRKSTGKRFVLKSISEKVCCLFKQFQDVGLQIWTTELYRLNILQFDGSRYDDDILWCQILRLVHCRRSDISDSRWYLGLASPCLSVYCLCYSALAIASAWENALTTSLGGYHPSP